MTQSYSLRQTAASNIVQIIHLRFNSTFNGEFFRNSLPSGGAKDVDLLGVAGQFEHGLSKGLLIVRRHENQRFGIFFMSACPMVCEATTTRPAAIASRTLLENPSLELG